MKIRSILVIIIIATICIGTLGCGFDSKSALKGRVNDYYEWLKDGKYNAKNYADFFPPSPDREQRVNAEVETLKRLNFKVKAYSIEYIRMNEPETYAQVTVHRVYSHLNDIMTGYGKQVESSPEQIVMTWQKINEKWYCVGQR